MAKTHITGDTRRTFFRCYTKAVEFYGVVFEVTDDASVSATPLEPKLPPIEERLY